MIIDIDTLILIFRGRSHDKFQLLMMTLYKNNVLFLLVPPFNQLCISCRFWEPIKLRTIKLPETLTLKRTEQ